MHEVIVSLPRTVHGCRNLCITMHAGARAMQTCIVAHAYACWEDLAPMQPWACGFPIQLPVQVIIGGRNKYMINGHAAQEKCVARGRTPTQPASVHGMMLPPPVPKANKNITWRPACRGHSAELDQQAGTCLSCLPRVPCAAA